MAWMKTSLKGAGPGMFSSVGRASSPSSWREEGGGVTGWKPVPRGFVERKYRLNIVIRETHSVMISRAVVSTLVGLNAGSSDSKSSMPELSLAADASGQPMVLSGQRALENQVSRTSGSWVKPASSRIRMSSRVGSDLKQINRSSSCSPDCKNSRVTSSSSRRRACSRPSVKPSKSQSENWSNCSKGATPLRDHTGIRCPHQSWRLIHQSRRLSCQVS